MLKEGPLTTWKYCNFATVVFPTPGWLYRAREDGYPHHHSFGHLSQGEVKGTDLEYTLWCQSKVNIWTFAPQASTREEAYAIRGTDRGSVVSRSPLLATNTQAKTSTKLGNYRKQWIDEPLPLMTEAFQQTYRPQRELLPWEMWT